MDMGQIARFLRREILKGDYPSCGFAPWTGLSGHMPRSKPLMRTGP